MRGPVPSNVSQASTTEGARSRPPLRRWHWYHFYFLLALFDLAVIAISLYQYHRVLRSYSVALTELIDIDHAELWVGNLRLAVVQLNAPGNDVFETQRGRAEHERFDRTHVRYRALVERAPEFGVDLTEFHDHMQGMVREAERIFEIFERIQANGMTGEEQRETLAAATSFMPSMDRYQADALKTLAGVADSLSAEGHRLLNGYGAYLEKAAAGEKYLLGTVILILVGVFWYGRKLQSTHETLIAEQQQSLEEKHARLAAVGEVCTAVSHGIKNPLAAITSSAQLALEYGTHDESTKLRIQDVLDESRRLNGRVGKLLEFAGAARERFEPCDVSQVVLGAIHEIRPKLEDCNVHVTTECAKEPLIVDGNRDWLAQAVIEVVSNSIDSLPNGGRIDVRCKRDAKRRNRARVDVIDNGPGIAESVRPHVFDLFFTSKADGNGIGLASVKRVVDMHGGEVSVRDTSGSGTHIEIILPIA